MDRPNIILVVFDTLRRDALGCYGGSRSTPNIDSFAEEAFKFENAVAPSPWTAPSHASMFTGKYPSEHGVVVSKESKLEIIPKLMKNYSGSRLAELLKKKGYHCEGMSANPMISNNTGFDIGFDHFTEIPIRPNVKEELEELNKLLSGEGDPSTFEFSTIQAAKRLISKGKFLRLLKAYGAYTRIKKKVTTSGYPVDKGGRFLLEVLRNSSYELPLFLFLNFMEAHDPYLASEAPIVMRHSSPLQLMDLLHYKSIPNQLMTNISEACFDRARVIDRNFRHLIDFLISAKLYDKSWLIVTSDHGQSLHEKGYYGHGIFLHDELVRIPLLVKPPKGVIISSNHTGYQSLRSIFDCIENLLEEDTSFQAMNSTTVFSESYGIQHHLIDNLPSSTPELKSTWESIDRPRKAVFKGGNKLVIEGKSGEIEEFVHNGRSVLPKEEPKVISDLIRELEIFRGRERFNLPDA